MSSQQGLAVELMDGCCDRCWQCWQCWQCCWRCNTNV